MQDIKYLFKLIQSEGCPPLWPVSPEIHLSVLMKKLVWKDSDRHRHMTTCALRCLLDSTVIAQLIHSCLLTDCKPCCMCYKRLDGAIYNSLCDNYRSSKVSTLKTLVSCVNLHVKVQQSFNVHKISALIYFSSTSKPLIIRILLNELNVQLLPDKRSGVNISILVFKLIIHWNYFNTLNRTFVQQFNNPTNLSMKMFFQPEFLELVHWISFNWSSLLQ